MTGGVRSTAADVAAGRRTAVELAARITEAIGRRDAGVDGLHAFLAHDPAALVAEAAAVDRAVAGGDVGLLAGVPVAVKDNLCTTGLPTTCGSRILEGFVSPYDAAAVRRVRAAGGVVAGKTNMDEFAMGSSTESSAFGPTRNPHDPDRVPGGSSGGSAAAVAAGLVPAALGSETGGSVRQPAALCGVVGLKPTYGRVSRYGLVAFASSLDQVGTLATGVADAALLLRVIAGRDARDATTADVAVPDLVAAVGQDVEGLVVGVPGEFFGDELHAGVRARAERAIRLLREAGAEIRDISLPLTRYALPTYYVLAPAEASSNLARYDGVRYGRRVEADAFDALVRGTRTEGFGTEVRRRILLGTHVLSAGYQDRYYGRAQAARRRIAAEVRRTFASGIDVLFTPTTPRPAFRLGERLDDPYTMYRSDLFTVTASLAGIPAISVPIGEADGLPVGGQLMAGAWQEATLVRAAAGLERALEAA